MGRTANTTSKTTVAAVRSLNYIQKQQVASIEKMDCGICPAAILLRNQSRETGRSRIERLTLCLEVLNNPGEQCLSQRW